MRNQTWEIHDEAAYSGRAPNVNTGGPPATLVGHWQLHTDTHQPLHSEGEEGTKGKYYPQHRTGNES